jgi:hypothetical protein
MLPVGPAVIHLDISGGLTWRAADLARTIAARTGYVGNWLACLRLAPISTFRGYLAAWQRDPVLPYTYPDDEYRSDAVFTFAEVDRDTDGIVDRLLGGLGRALAGRDIEFPTRRERPEPAEYTPPPRRTG